MQNKPMRSLTSIKNVDLEVRSMALDCAIDGEGRLCLLSQVDPRGRVAEFNDIRLSVPDDWAPHVRRIRWLSDSRVALWPIAPSKSRGPYIGTMGRTETSTIESAFPLDVFADNGFMACTFSEERLVATANLEMSSDMISFFSRTGKKIGRFVDTYLNNYSQDQFLEVVHGVLDGWTERFWFTAYSTNRIWCLSFKEGIKVSTSPLGCSLKDVLAISCNGDAATLIARREGRLILRKFSKTESDVTFASESEISSESDISRYLENALSTRQGYILGLRGNLLSFVGRNRVILASL